MLLTSKSYETILHLLFFILSYYIHKKTLKLSIIYILTSKYQNNI